MKRMCVVMFVVGLWACGGSPETQPPPAQPQASAPQAARVDVPNRTKAVRLIVVPDGVNDGGSKLQSFVESERAAKNDIFIVGNKPMSYVGGKLIEHWDAVTQNSEALPFIDVPGREQLQWQSTVEFEITRIEKAGRTLRTMRRAKEWPIADDPAAPPNPFGALKSGARGGPGKPIRSGLANIPISGNGQVYGVSLAVTVNGQRHEISPAVYVWACGVGSRCTIEDEERRTARQTYVDAAAPSLPNRTKVVRLIVLPDGFDRKDSAAVNQVVQRESATETDVFIVGNEPFSYNGEALVDHHTASRTRAAVVFAMVLEREQIQWESNVDFIITYIHRQKEPSPDFDAGFPGAPENPFLIVKEGDGGGPGRPIQSGVANLGDNETKVGQLYKLAFRITVDGKPRDIDPDTYCDM